MKYIRVLGLVAVLAMYVSCNKDDVSTPVLEGLYTETAPTNGRSQLNFINENTVIKSEVGTVIQDEFTYEIIGNTIKLTPNWNSATAQEFEIEIMNTSKFEIENLYPSIGLDPTTYMTFEK